MRPSMSFRTSGSGAIWSLALAPDSIVCHTRAALSNSVVVVVVMANSFVWCGRGIPTARQSLGTP